LANEGDLFGWCDKAPKPGKEREPLSRPLALQLFEAVRWMHELGISHGDLSLENILLTSTGKEDLNMQIIDFGMATLDRQRQGVFGKASYQAPEMHKDEKYDAFASDNFAVGVTLFAMTTHDFPWQSTKPNTDALFEYIRNCGLRSFVAKRKLRTGNGENIKEAMSDDLFDLIEGLIQLKSQDRFNLGETCFEMEQSSTRSVLTMQWMIDSLATKRPPSAAAPSVSRDVIPESTSETGSVSSWLGWSPVDLLRRYQGRCIGG
jgi:serine/threonine protein kinase